jgi:hypothetical protein
MDCRGEHDQAATPAAVADTVRRCTQALTAGLSGDHRRHRRRTAGPGDLATSGPNPPRDAGRGAVRHTPLPVALARNRARSRHVPEHVIITMWTTIARTTPAALMAEGFHAVLTIDTTTPATNPDRPRPANEPAPAHRRPLR